MDDGHKAYLAIETFINNVASTTRPQGLLYLNGKIAQGIDINHTSVEVAEGKYTMYLHYYTHTFGNALPVYFSLKTVDVAVRNAYYDLSVPVNGLALLQTDSDEYFSAVSTLERACNLVDFRNPYSDEFYTSIDNATKYLQDNYYGKLCNSPVTVNCIGHTHIDVAWLWDLEQTRQKVERSFATVLQLMDRYPEYRFMSSQPQLFAYLKQTSPQLFEQVKKRVAEGRWELDGSMWLEADCNLTGGESLVRQIYYGKKFFKDEFGVDCSCVWLPDVFGYSASLPQIMVKSGIKRFVTAKIGWNDTNRMPYDIFEWQGLDGSKVLAYLLSTCFCDPRNGVYDRTYTSYCEPISPRAVLGTWHRFQQKELTDTLLMSYGYGDGGGGPTDTDIEIQRRMNKGLAGIPKAKLCSLKQSLDTIENNFYTNCKQLKRLPKWNGELYFEFHRGTLTSVPRIKMNNRKAEIALANAELWNAVNAKLLQNSYPSQSLEQNWKVLLLNQFHDILPGSAIEKVYLDSDKQFASLFDETTALIDNAQNSIAKQITSDGGWAVFNPNGFEANGTVVIDGQTRVVENVGSIGYKVVSLPQHKQTVRIDGRKLENSLYSIQFDQSGAIESFVDKRNGRQLVQQGNCINVFCAYEDTPYMYDNWEISPDHKSKRWTLDEPAEFLQIVDGDRAGLQITKHYGKSTITQKVFLYSFGIDRVDFVTDVDWHEKRQLLKVEFPFDLFVTKATCDVQFGNLERTTSQNTSWDVARFEAVCHKWIDVGENNYGVALLNDGKYGFGTKDNVVTMTVLKSGSYPYDNATDIVPTFTYSLLPHTDTFRQGNVIQNSTVLNRPFSAIKVEQNKGTLPSEMSLVNIDAKGVFAETVKQAEDGNGIVVRMYEAFCERKQVTLQCAMPFQQAFICNLDETAISAVPVTDGKVTFDIKPYEIVTVKLV